MRLIEFESLTFVDIGGDERYPEQVFINPEHVVYVKTDPEHPGNALLRLVNGAFCVNGTPKDVAEDLVRGVSV